MKWFVLAALIATPVCAEDLIFSPYAVEDCFANGGTGDTCIGASAASCMEATPGGYSTVVMGGCTDREWSYWDDRLNAAYGRVMVDAKRMDAEMVSLGSAVAKQAPALRDMQRAWITFRDRQCEYEASTWGGGTGAGPASLACMMELTARQALFLESKLDR